MPNGHATQTVTLTFASVQTMAGAADARRMLLDALAAAPRVTVDCTQVTAVDLSFIQVLLAARRSAKARGAVLSLSTPAGGPLREALERAGLLGGIGVDGMVPEDSFWTEATP